MDTEVQPEKKRRGRRPRSVTATDTSKLKPIELDADLQELLKKKTSSVQQQILRVKLPASVIEELQVNVDSLNSTANTKIDVNRFVNYALEMANDNLKEILKKHLTQ